MMENLIETYEENGENFECIIACKKECQHGGITSCHCKPVLEIRHKLHAYELTGLTPEEITAMKSERDTLKKVLEKYQKTEQWFNDMNNPLEPIKVSAALNSEIMKLNYRKEHKPESISELDGTIISALLFVQQAQEQEGNHE